MFNSVEYVADLEKRLATWDSLARREGKKLGSGHSRTSYLMPDGWVYKIPHSVDYIDMNRTESRVWEQWRQGLSMGRPCRPAECYMVDDIVLRMELVGIVLGPDGKPMRDRYDNLKHRREDGATEKRPRSSDFKYSTDGFQAGIDRIGAWVQYDFAGYQRATPHEHLCILHHPHGEGKSEPAFWPQDGATAKWAKYQSPEGGVYAMLDFFMKFTGRLVPGSYLYHTRSHRRFQKQWFQAMKTPEGKAVWEALGFFKRLQPSWDRRAARRDARRQAMGKLRAPGEYDFQTINVKGPAWELDYAKLSGLVNYVPLVLGKDTFKMLKDMEVEVKWDWGWPQPKGMAYVDAAISERPPAKPKKEPFFPAAARAPKPGVPKRFW